MRACGRESLLWVQSGHRRPMLNATTSVITRALKARIGWNRIGLAISLLIIVMSSVTLYRLLRDIDVDKVLVAIQATSIQTILIAGVFVAIGYVTLTFYDFFSLRTIGKKDVPYR